MTDQPPSTAATDSVRDNYQRSTAAAHRPCPADDATCISIKHARAVLVGWAVWTGVAGFVVGHWGGSTAGAVVGWLWIFTVIWLIQEWADV